MSFSFPYVGHWLLFVKRVRRLLNRPRRGLVRGKVWRSGIGQVLALSLHLARGYYMGLGQFCQMGAFQRVNTPCAQARVNLGARLAATDLCVALH